MSKIEVYHKTSHTLLTINPVKVDVATTETVWEITAKVGDIFLTILHSEEKTPN
jgi:hypothetical protein